MAKFTNEEPQVRERSVDWLKDRIEHLEAKLPDLDNRKKLVKKEIEERKAELALKSRSKAK